MKYFEKGGNNQNLYYNTFKKLASTLRAIALANKVLPVPGGP